MGVAPYAEHGKSGGLNKCYRELDYSIRKKTYVVAVIDDDSQRKIIIINESFHSMFKFFCKVLKLHRPKIAIIFPRPYLFQLVKGMQFIDDLKNLDIE